MEDKDLSAGGANQSHGGPETDPPEAEPGTDDIVLGMGRANEAGLDEDSDAEGRAKFRESLLSGISQAEGMPPKGADPLARKLGGSLTPFDWQTYDPSKGKDKRKEEAQGTQSRIRGWGLGLPQNRDIPPGQEYHLRALLEAKTFLERWERRSGAARQALRDDTEEGIRGAGPANPGGDHPVRAVRSAIQELLIDADLHTAAQHNGGGLTMGGHAASVDNRAGTPPETSATVSSARTHLESAELGREWDNLVVQMGWDQSARPEEVQAGGTAREQGSTCFREGANREPPLCNNGEGGNNMLGEGARRRPPLFNNGEGGSNMSGEGARRRHLLCKKAEDNRFASARRGGLRESKVRLNGGFPTLGGPNNELDGGLEDTFPRKGGVGGASIRILGARNLLAASDDEEPEHNDSSDEELPGEGEGTLKQSAKQHKSFEDEDAGGHNLEDGAALGESLGLERCLGLEAGRKQRSGRLERGLGLMRALSGGGDPAFDDLKLDLLEDEGGDLGGMNHSLEDTTIALNAKGNDGVCAPSSPAGPRFHDAPVVVPSTSFENQPDAAEARWVVPTLRGWADYFPTPPLSPPLEMPEGTGDLFEDVDAFAQDAGAEPSETADAWMTSAEQPPGPRQRRGPVIRDLDDLRKFSKMEAERKALREKTSKEERPTQCGKPPLKKRVRKLVDFGKGSSSVSGSLLSKPAKRLIASLPKGVPSSERTNSNGRFIRPPSQNPTPPANLPVPAESYFGVEAADPELPVFDLTQDLLYQVFSHLDALSLCSVAQVCRQWGAMSAHEDFWHTLDFGRKELREEEIVEVCKKFPKASTVLLSGSTRLVESLVRSALGRLSCLTSLSIKDVHTTLPSADAFFRALTEHCPELRSLAVTETSLTSPVVVISHPLLETLNLDRSHSQSLKLSCPVLRSLSLQRAVVTSFTLECPLIDSVNVSACHKLHDGMLRSALATCPNLRVLDVSNCALVTDDTLRMVANTCPKMEQLDTSHCPLLTFANMRFPELLKLKAVGGEAVGAACVNMLAYSHKLEHLTLDYCWALEALTLELYHLHSLSLFNCRKLSEVRLRTLRLSALNLKSCDNLGTVDLYSAEIRDLSLRGQPLLQTVRLRGPELTSLDLSDCDGLQELGEAAFLSEQACPKIARLVLDNCEGLSTLRLSSPSLSCLSLAGCSNLRSVDLACPALTSLRTEGCNRLSRARLAPVALADVTLGTCPYLTSLNIQSAGMEGLDLRGCGALGQVELDCPNMTRLDTSYCSKLSSLSMAPLTAKCHSLNTLILAGATICSDGLLALSGLKALTKLDLSYTEVQSLAPVFVACDQLEVLLLSACKRLPDSALVPLHHRRRLPALEELDVSYCNLTAQAVGDLFAFAPHLARLSLNGCSKLDDSIWRRLAECPVALPVQSRQRSKPAPASLECTGESSGQSEGSTGSPGRVTKRLRDVSLADVRGEARQRMLTSQEVISWDNPPAENGDPMRCDTGAKPCKGVQEGPRLNQNGGIRQTKKSFGGEQVIDPEPLQRAAEELQSNESPPMDAEAPSLSSRLTSLSLVGCTGLSLVRIADTCGELTELNVSLSGNIRTIELACPKLAHLNLNQCASLGLAEISCPNLRILKLQGSKLSDSEVLKLLQRCSVLETLDVRGCTQLTSETFRLLRDICPAMRRLHSDAH